MKLILKALWFRCFGAEVQQEVVIDTMWLTAGWKVFLFKSLGANFSKSLSDLKRRHQLEWKIPTGPRPWRCYSFLDVISWGAERRRWRWSARFFTENGPDSKCLTHLSLGRSPAGHRARKFGRHWKKSSVVTPNQTTCWWYDTVASVQQGRGYFLDVSYAGGGRSLLLDSGFISLCVGLRIESSPSESLLSLEFLYSRGVKLQYTVGSKCKS